MPTESFGKRGIKMDLNPIALLEVKLLSHYKVICIPYKIHISLFRYDSTCDGKHRLEKVIDSR